MTHADRSQASRIPWSRRTHPPLITSEGVPHPEAAQELRSLNELRDVPVVVLIGERGSGKTDAFAAECHALSKEGLDVAAPVHLPMLAGDPIGYLKAQAPAPDAGEGPWFVLLDSYDEALHDIPALHAHLNRWCQGLDDAVRDRLRLRIATRPGSAVVGAQLYNTLTSLWPKQDAVAVRELARLTEEEIRVAARHKQVEPEAFAAKVRRQGLAPIASIPVTLVELLDDAAAGRPLPSTLSEAYERAARRWCKETNDEREPPPDVDVQLLVHTAEQVAAALHFCADAGVVTERDNDPVGLPLHELADGPEAPRLVTENLLRTLQSCGLMRWISPGRHVFAHRGMQEYLASQYLRHRELSPATLKALLVAGQGTVRHAVFALRDLAGWVASWSTEVFEDLLEHDPVTLLSADLASRPEADRGRVAQALIALASRQGTFRMTAYESQLYRLDFPGLPAILQPHLRAPHSEQERLRLGQAILIAQAASPGNRPVEALLGLAEEQSLDSDWRAAALRSVIDVDFTPNQVERINGLADAGSREVADAAVEVLWPRHITLQVMTSHIESGNVSPQRVHVLFDAARDADLRPLMAWAKTYLEQPGAQVASAAQGIAWAAERLEELAAENRASDADIKALAEAFAALAALPDLDDHVDVGGFPDRLRRPVEHEGLRRRLGSRLLELTDRDGLHHLLWGPLQLFPVQDRIYWAHQFSGCSAAAQDLLAVVLRAGPGRLSAEQRQELEQLAASDPAVGALIEPWWTPAPVTPAEVTHRQHMEGLAAQWRFSLDVVVALLGQRPACTDPEQVRQWWGQLAGAVGFRTVDGAPPKANFDTVLDLTKTYGWATMDAALRQQVTQAGIWAVEHCPPVTPNNASVVLGYTLTDAPEVLALSMPGSEAALSGLSGQRWAGLALVLMVAQVRREDAELRSELLRRAVLSSGVHFRGPLHQALTGLSEFAVGDAVTTLLDAVPERKDDVAGWAATPARDFIGWVMVCTSLAAAGHQQVLASVRAELPATPYSGDGQVNNEWLRAADVLLRYGAESDRQELWETILADRELTKAWAQSGFVAGAERLSPTQLGRMFDHLVDAGLFHRDRMTTTPFLATMPAVPDLIARAGSPEAVTVLERLVIRHPGWPRLPQLLRQCQLLAAEYGRERLDWPTLRDLTRKKDLRLVQDASQLADLVMDTLREIQQRLTGPNGLAPLLWNRTADKHNPTRPDPDKPNPLGWWPLWEQDLSDLVHHLLDIRLRGHRLIINREVQLDRESRTDILVQAVHPDSPDRDPITVVIEVKGCWNRQVDTSLQAQLTDQYLNRYRKAAGIYLVGYFDSGYWGKKPKADGTPTKDSRKGSEHPDHTLETLRSDNEERARQASSSLLDVRAFVLDCRPDLTITARDQDPEA